MHLIHAHLIGPGVLLPPGTASVLLDVAPPHIRLEHAVVHQEWSGEAVIGVYLLAADARQARTQAIRLFLLVTRPEGTLSGWLLVDLPGPLLNGLKGP